MRGVRRSFWTLVPIWAGVQGYLTYLALRSLPRWPPSTRSMCASVPCAPANCPACGPRPPRVVSALALAGVASLSFWLPTPATRTIFDSAVPTALSALAGAHWPA
jgi:hypothetical protein